MTTFTRDSNGIPRCQVLIDGQPCNGFLLLTQDSRYLTCEKLHGKLFPVDSEQAADIRQAYRNRDTPSQTMLNRRWKESLLVAVKIGTLTRTAYSRDKIADVKERVTVYKIDDATYEATTRATRITKTVGRQVVACVVSNSGVRSAKLFAPLPMTEEQIAKLQKKAKRPKS